MEALTEEQIRSCFVNTSQGEARRMPLPGLHEVIWDQREYLGWRDPSAPQRGYLVHWVDGRPVGLLLRAAGVGMRAGISAMCSLCRTSQPSDQVTMFSAPKAGKAGRDGNTVGTYICADLACSIIIRITPPKLPMQPDPEEIVARRIEGLQARLQNFTADIMRTA